MASRVGAGGGGGSGAGAPPGPDRRPGLLALGPRTVLDDPGAGLDLAFQPVVDLQRGVVVGYEALARLAGPPSAPPDRWSAAAAGEGLAARLEASVLERALPTRAADRIRDLVRSAGEEDTVGPLVEPVTTVPVGAGGEAAARFAADGALDVAPVVDRWERPVALHRRADALAGSDPVPEVVRVQAADSVAGVARRVVGRPRASRFDPLLCCDGMGRCRGVVRVERLLETLAG